jgi:hypothetical protein
VTLVAAIFSAGIVNPGAASEGCRGMAEVAIQCGRNMGGAGFGIHADCRTTIMTGHTIIHDAGMVEYRAGETQREAGGMTDTAILVSLYMGARFTDGEGAIMT